MHAKEFISSKFAIGALLLLLSFLGSIKYQQWQSDRAVSKLKNDLLQQAASQEQKNKELNESISYLSSDDFKERVARQQLNLRKEGEVVYNFSQKDVVVSDSDKTVRQQSNSEKWWDYFFGSK